MSEREKLLDRVRKLFALATDNPSPEEAAEAARKAAEQQEKGVQP